MPKGKKYKIPIYETVEIVNPESPYFRRQGTLCVVYKNIFTVAFHENWVQFVVCNDGTIDSDGPLEIERFDRNDILPLQNILIIDSLDAETLAKIFEREYLYETNRVVVYYKEFSRKKIEKAYYKLAANIAKGKCSSGYDEKVLVLLDEMRGYDKEEIYNAIGESINAEQWWIEGLRKHCYTEKSRKKSRFLETKRFTVDFIKI